MNRKDIFKSHGLAVLQCLALLFDALTCVLLSIILLLWALATGQAGQLTSPFETLSASCGRAFLNGKLAGRIVMPAVDLICKVFQPEPFVDLPDGRRFTHPSHCVRAFIKTRTLAYLPPEYRGPLPPSIEACFSAKDS